MTMTDSGEQVMQLHPRHALCLDNRVNIESPTGAGR